MKPIKITEELYLSLSNGGGGGVYIYSSGSAAQVAYMGGMEDLRKMARAILDQLGEPLHVIHAPDPRDALAARLRAADSRWVLSNDDGFSKVNSIDLDDLILHANSLQGASSIYELRAYVGPVERQVVR